MGASHSNGLAERQVDLIKLSYAKAKEMYPDLGISAILDKVTMARNMVPLLQTGICPMSLMTGRADLFEVFESTPQINTADLATDPQGIALQNAQMNLKNIFNLRNEMIKWEANKALMLCDSKRFRLGASELPRCLAEVEIFEPLHKRWSTGFRMVGKYGSHGLIERGKILRRHPLCWIRPRSSGVTLPFS